MSTFSRMKTPSNKELLEVCVESARAAGGHALKNLHRRGEIARSFDHDVKLVMEQTGTTAAAAREALAATDGDIAGAILRLTGA